MKIIGKYSITSENMTSDIRFLGSCKVVIDTQQEYEVLKQAMERFNQGARRVDMRIIFQNGEIAELNNVEKIVVYNDMEYNILGEAMMDYITKEGTNEQHSSSTEIRDESVSERNVAQESSQHARQTSICDIPEEAGGEGTP